MQLEGTRRKGRPRKRWKEEVERDLQVLGVRRWRGLVADTKDIFRQAKIHSGCSANGIIIIIIMCRHIYEKQDFIIVDLHWK